MSKPIDNINIVNTGECIERLEARCAVYSTSDTMLLDYIAAEDLTEREKILVALRIGIMLGNDAGLHGVTIPYRL